MKTGLDGAFRRFNLGNELARPKTLKTAICEETTRWCVERYGRNLCAIILTGSLARDEATFIEEGKRWSLLGDADLLLIFHERVPLPPSVGLDLLRRRIEEMLLQRNMLCHISLSSVHPTYLRKLKPHIFAYELKVWGQIAWGDPQILSLIPAFSASDIPLEDAWRLLCNRMIEQLDMVDELADRPATLSRRVYYQTVKLYLDMATSYLLFAGAYEPTYRGRAEKLSVLADSLLQSDTFPFPLRDFAERVSACTQEKLLGPGRGGLSIIPGERAPGMVFWEEAVTYTERLWRWELVRLTGLSDHVSSCGLWEGWMRLQPFPDRFRGWVSVLRRSGRHRSWRYWLRWSRYGWRASPRYWVYAVASALFFRLPSLVMPEDQRAGSDLDWGELCCWLPMVQKASRCAEQPGWRELASDILWNYHKFLEGTRA